MTRYLVACLVALSVGAAAAGGERAPGPAATPGYLFVPGDVLEITVSSHPGYDRTITVPPDGRVQFPLVGEITAAGLTSLQLARRLAQGLDAELVDPQVTVSLKALNQGLARRVSVLGAVKSPGVFELREKATLFELLAAAGGPTPVADLSRISLTRAASGKQVTTDLSTAARTGDVKDPVVLESGDLILVPEGAPPSVSVMGEVARPGSYPLQGEMRLLDALSLAGGPSGKADLRRVSLTHAGQSGAETVDLQELLAGGPARGADANVVLRPGDALLLPESEHKFYVLGEVNKPAAYPLKPVDHLLDAITTAGGSTHEADLSQVMLIRKDPQGQLGARRVNLKKMLRQGDLDRNEALREGDVVFVPNRKPTRPFAEYLGFLYPLSGILSALR